MQARCRSCAGSPRPRDVRRLHGKPVQHAIRSEGDEGCMKCSFSSRQMSQFRGNSLGQTITQVCQQNALGSIDARTFTISLTLPFALTCGQHTHRVHKHDAFRPRRSIFDTPGSRQWPPKGAPCSPEAHPAQRAASSPAQLWARMRGCAASRPPAPAPESMCVSS